MGKEEIVARILSDAEAEANAIVAEANARAEEILREAEKEREETLQKTRAEAEERAGRIASGKAAASRLDAAKIDLAGRRRAIDAVYAHALRELLSLDKRRAVELAARLLSDYAEQGDEIVFAENFPFTEDVKALPIVRERGLSVSEARIALSGGFILRGIKSDKDTSYLALLAADREAHQSEIAHAIFKEEA